jgi:hypothetical protein
MVTWDAQRWVMQMIGVETEKGDEERLSKPRHDDYPVVFALFPCFG